VNGPNSAGDQQNPYVILDGIRGSGRYVGTFLSWTQLSKGWFGEGEVKFYIDGDKEFPTICFDQDLRVTIQALGWKGPKYDKLSDDIASVAYWYQTDRAARPISTAAIVANASAGRPTHVGSSRFIQKAAAASLAGGQGKTNTPGAGRMRQQ